MNKFDEFNNKPDLRNIGVVVKCIKNYYNNFKKGNYYEVKGFYGDPHRAIEEFGIADYLPIECINKIILIGDNKKRKEFAVNKKRYITSTNSPDFFRYFEPTGIDTKKYNL